MQLVACAIEDVVAPSMRYSFTLKMRRSTKAYCDIEENAMNGIPKRFSRGILMAFVVREITMNGNGLALGGL